MTERITRGRARALNHSTPKWVMVGLEWDGPGVLLMASKQLGRAALDFEARQYDFRDMEDLKRNFNPSLSLTVTIADDKSYVLIAADNYVEAIRALFGEWTPDDEPAELEQRKPPELGGAAPAITAGSAWEVSPCTR